MIAATGLLVLLRKSESRLILVSSIADEPKRGAGIALSAHALIEPQAIGAFLGGGALQPASSETLSAGAIAEREKAAVAAVNCGR